MRSLRDMAHPYQHALKVSIVKTDTCMTLALSAANLQLSTFAGLQIIGTVGRTYQVQSSPDMTTWSTAATVLLTATPFLWIDQHPISGNKFYRAFMLP